MSMLLALLLLGETGEIIDSLSPDELKMLQELPDYQREIAVRYLRNATPNSYVITISRSEIPHMKIGPRLFRISDSVSVDQVVDKQAFIGFGQNVWFEGVDTSNLVDNSAISLKNIQFVYADTKTYKTVLSGSKTVKHFVAVRANSDELLKVLRKITEPRGYRVWGEGSEAFIIAKYIKSSPRSVVVEPLGERPKQISRTKLTPIDETWVKNEQAKQQETK